MTSAKNWPTTAISSSPSSFYCALASRIYSLHCGSIHTIRSTNAYNSPLRYVEHMCWGRFCQEAFVNRPQSTKDTEQWAFTAAIGSSYQKMHSWFYLWIKKILSHCSTYNSNSIQRTHDSKINRNYRYTRPCERVRRSNTRHQHE